MEGVSGVTGAGGRDMIIDALRSLGAGHSGKGATTAEITKFLVAEHQVPSERAQRQVSMALKRALDNGELLKQGYHYKLADEDAAEGQAKEAARRGRRRRRMGRRRRSRSRRRRSRSPRYRSRSRSQGGGSSASPAPHAASPAPAEETEHIREAARRGRRRRRMGRRRRSRSRRRRSRSRSRSAGSTF